MSEGSDFINAGDENAQERLSRAALLLTRVTAERITPALTAKKELDAHEMDLIGQDIAAALAELRGTTIVRTITDRIHVTDQVNAEILAPSIAASGGVGVPTITVTASIDLRWNVENERGVEPATIDDLLYLLKQQVMVLDDIRDAIRERPSALEVYVAVITTLQLAMAVLAYLRPPH